ncbi:hypothetical protein SY88_12325 [Clostridiales bacterium PH28_bin88]|nr:hypothetical protein SY88_12325 [Clostridiales bacterium PH28_bin88]
MLGKKALVAVVMVLALVMTVLAGCGGKQSAQQSGGDQKPAAEESVLKGKTLTLIVPHSPGKGFDTYARMAAPFIEKYSGATVVVKNVTGAGGVVGTNELWNSKPDGLTFGFSSIPSLLLAQLSGAEGVQFDATKFTYLARMATEPRVFAVGGKSKFNSVEDLKNAGRPIKFPSQGLDDDFFIVSVMAKAMGFELQQITGYEGNADTSLAVVKGDGDGHMTALSDAEPMIKAGDKKPIVFIAKERLKDYPNVPTALELTTGEANEFMKVVTTMVEMHRSFFGPPGMDPKAAKELRTAIEKALTDPELVKKAAEGNKPINFMPGEQAQWEVEAIAASAQKIVPVLKEAVAAVK